MTTQQQQISLSTKRLYLTKDRLLKHYLDVIIFTGLTLLFFLLIGNGFINKQGHYNSPYFLLFLIFPTLTLLIYFNKRQELRLKDVHTNLPKSENHKIVRATLKQLGWQVKVDNKGFLEAYTDNFGFFTWTDQMISVLIDDNKISFNSIGNVDTLATQGFSWGQNIRNKRQFIETFELLATSDLLPKK